MKIRTQYALMVAGIVAIPLLIAALWWAINYYTHETNNPVPEYGQLAAADEKRVDSETWNKIRQNMPKDGDFLIMAKDFRILYTNAPKYRHLAYWPPENMKTLIDSGQNFMLLYTPPSSPSSDGVTVLYLPTEIRTPGSFYGFFMVFIGSILLVLLAFSIVTSILIVRSHVRAITKLDHATKELARGNLDQPIIVGGNDEIRSLGHSFEEMRLALKEENARQSRFVMGVSHDLKTPLALIRGYVELLREGWEISPPDREHYFTLVVDKAEHLDSMIDELIDFMKIDTGEWQEKLRPVDMAAFLGEIGHRIQTEAQVQRRRFQTRIELDPGLTVKLEEKSFRRCLENLVFNAFRYTRENDLIEITARQTGRYLELIVSDSGPGIDAKDLPHVFEHFYRGSGSRREPGLGLGLAIVKTIVESHGASISAASPGGAVFTITLPLEAANETAP